MQFTWSFVSNISAGSLMSQIPSPSRIGFFSRASIQKVCVVLAVIFIWQYSVVLAFNVFFCAATITLSTCKWEVEIFNIDVRPAIIVILLLINVFFNVLHPVLLSLLVAMSIIRMAIDFRRQEQLVFVLTEKLQEIAQKIKNTATSIEGSVDELQSNFGVFTTSVDDLVFTKGDFDILIENVNKDVEVAMNGLKELFNNLQDNYKDVVEVGGALERLQLLQKEREVCRKVKQDFDEMQRQYGNAIEKINAFLDTAESALKKGLEYTNQEQSVVDLVFKELQEFRSLRNTFMIKNSL